MSETSEHFGHHDLYSRSQYLKTALSANYLESISRRILKEGGVVPLSDFRAPLRRLELTSAGVARDCGNPIDFFWAARMKRQSHLICDMTRRFDQCEGFLNAPFRESVVDDVPASLPLAPKAERFQESVVKWPCCSDLDDSYVNMIEDHTNTFDRVDARAFSRIRTSLCDESRSSPYEKTF